MSMNKSWNSVKNYLYKEYGKDGGNMIVHAGALGWVLSSLAQITALGFNDKIPPEQKKFLIPQEIGDAVVNVISYYLVSKGFKDIGNTLVKSGKWSSANIRKFVSEHAKDLKLGDLKTDLESKFSGNDEFYKAYDPFKNGVAMISTTIGSIISCNIITPILRNKIGARQQRISLAQDKMNNKQTEPVLLPSVPVLPAQNRFGIEDYKRQASMNISRSGGAMKI